MSTPSDRQPSRPEQPPLFETPADDHTPTPPAEPPVLYGRPRLRTANRDQIVFRAAALDEIIPPDHPARVVWDYTDGLDLSSLYNLIKSVEGNPGRPPIDPKILMALWLYATIDGVGSARQLDELCRSHSAYQWICGDVRVNYHTLSDFRTDHGELLDRLLTQSVAVLLAEGLVALNRVAQDGMRVRASAGAASFRRRPTLEEALAEAEAQVQALRTELDEDLAASNRRQQKARERAARERVERIKGALDRLPELEATDQDTHLPFPDQDTHRSGPSHPPSYESTWRDRTKTQTRRSERLTRNSDAHKLPTYSSFGALDQRIRSRSLTAA